MAYYPSYKNTNDPVTIVEWATGTDEEIAAMLEAHYAGRINVRDYWTIGDERVVSLSAMDAMYVSETHVAQNVTLVLSEEGGMTLYDGVTECAFQVDQKDGLIEKGNIDGSFSFSGGWQDCPRRAWCSSVYKAAFPPILKGIFKTFITKSGKGGSSSSGVVDVPETFSLRAEIEVFGSTPNSVAGEGSQVEWYKTAANRIKKVNGSNSNWYERSPKKSNSGYWCMVDSSGNYTTTGAVSNSYGLAPFGVI